MELIAKALRLVAGVLAPAGERARLSILIYHRVLAEPDPLTGEIDAATFEMQIRTLREYFAVLSLAEAAARLRNGTLPARAVAITFDDGYADNFEVALPILRRHGLRATFFIATGFLDGGRMFNDTIIETVRRATGPTIDVPAVGLRGVRVASLDEKKDAITRLLTAVKYLDPGQRALATEQIAAAANGKLPTDLMMRSEQVLALARAGMDIGGHTVTHPILTRVSLREAQREIEENRRHLLELVGCEPEVFAYPNGAPDKDYGPEHVALVRQAGYRAAVSTVWGVAKRDTDVYQLPRFTPWDREPLPFVARLLHNCVARRARVTVPAGGTCNV